MKHSVFVIAACLIVSVATACQRDNETVAAPSQASPSVTSTHPAPNAQLTAFAGTFEGTIACEGDCQTAVSITFNADGTYAKTEKSAYGDGTSEAASETGTWAIEIDGKLIALDPDGGQVEGKWYVSIVSRNEINILGNKDAAYDPLYSIKRKPTTGQA